MYIIYVYIYIYVYAYIYVYNMYTLSSFKFVQNLVFKNATAQMLLNTF